MWFPNVGGPEFSNKIKLKSLTKYIGKKKKKKGDPDEVSDLRDLK